MSTVFQLCELCSEVVVVSSPDSGRFTVSLDDVWCISELAEVLDDSALVGAGARGQCVAGDVFGGSEVVHVVFLCRWRGVDGALIECNDSCRE